MRTAKDKPLSPGEALERFIMDDQIRCNDDVARSLDLVDEHKAAAKWVADHYRIEPREDEADYMPGIPSAERVLTSTPKAEPPRPLLLVQRMTRNRITGKRELIGSNKLFSESRRAIVKHWEENPPERPFNLRYLHDLFYAVWELSDLKQFHDTTTARKARQEKEAREREAIRQKLLSFIS